MFISPSLRFTIGVHPIYEISTMTFSGELAVKFALQAANQRTVPELIRLAHLAHSEGFSQVWVNDNLCQRNIFVVLAAIASRTPIKLGTSILTPYFRNPVDIADSLAALSELTNGRELSVGVARGDLAYAGQQIEMLKQACARGAALAEAATLLPDHAVKSCFVVGTPEECRDQLAPLLAEAERYKLGQISFTKLGPDYDDAIKLLRRHGLPR